MELNFTINNFPRQFYTDVHMEINCTLTNFLRYLYRILDFSAGQCHYSCCNLHLQMVSAEWIGYQNPRT